MCLKNKLFVVIVFCVIGIEVPRGSSVKLDNMNCGIDNSPEVVVGNIPIIEYPWIGVLYYVSNDETGETRAVTTVVLIQMEFVLAAAADIGPMPKANFRSQSRVLLGEDWTSAGRRVRSYVLHPEYGETLNTLALVQLKDPVRHNVIRPACPPPELLRDPEFYVMKFHENYNDLQKQVISVSHVPSAMCRDFYVNANLYARKMRPPHVTCAVSLEENKVCVWEAGAALVSRDAWGRWMLLGLGVRGPGCGAPARFLDMMSYFPWVEASLAKFQRLTISKLSKTSYVLRSGDEQTSFMRFGACDPEEKVNLIYREMIVLRTDNNMFQFLTYNMSIYENIEYSCLTLEVVNASAVSEMRVKHYCRRFSYGPACYAFRGSLFEISVYIVFSDKCRFEMFAWGFKKNMTLIDIQEWKWEEGTYYEDFTLTRVEYRGTAEQTGFGFEPLDDAMWIPDFDWWTTTEFDNSSWSSTTQTPDKGDEDETANPAALEKQGSNMEMDTEPPGQTESPESDFMPFITW